MKLIKAILSKSLPKRGERGFTLVELLIVLAILAVLAAVVIPNITGMFGRGASQAYDTDEETIQMSTATFYFDIHDRGGIDGHYYPTSDGATGSGSGVTGDTAGADWAAVLTAGFKPIYMGLLYNTPTGAVDWTLDGNVAAGERGPYLNELPKSASTNNSANGEGTYSWVIGANGKVYGLHLVTGTGFVIGFGDTYP